MSDNVSIKDDFVYGLRLAKGVPGRSWSFKFFEIQDGGGF